MRTYNKNKLDAFSESERPAEDAGLSPVSVSVLQTKTSNGGRRATDVELELRKQLVKDIPELANKPTETKTYTQSAKKKNKTRARRCKVKGIVGNRGTDTLMRNAYRAQLDMLALAATKANIMISLNGLLMSLLIITSTQMIALDGLYFIPIAVFLVTSALATTFAVFAARPDISRRKFRYHEFARDEAHLLSFEEFSDLRESEYIDAMSDLLQDQQRVYKNMIAHVHELGVEADRKYKHLYCSYTAFMTGTIITVVSLLVIVGIHWSGVSVSN